MSAGGPWQALGVSSRRAEQVLLSVGSLQPPLLVPREPWGLGLGEEHTQGVKVTVSSVGSKTQAGNWSSSANRSHLLAVGS